MNWRDRPRCDRTAAWAALQGHARRFVGAAPAFDLRAALADDPSRVQRFSWEAAGVFVDASKALIDDAASDALLALADECGLPAWRDAFLAGEPVNPTECRAAKHWLLRVPAGASTDPDAAEVHATLDAMLAFAEQVRADASITDIVHLGIGGSDLGPRMACAALDAHAPSRQRLHFVSKVDGHALDAVLRDLPVHGTLFIVASKSFSTTETMANARSALAWYAARGGMQVAQQFVGLTTNIAAARDLGITRTFGFRDWVGGRFSLWSAIGLPIAIAAGARAFRALLAGAHAMDQHFAQAPLARNLPVRLALLDLWYRNFLGCASRNIAPYHAGLQHLPAWWQQLEMESNGKRVDVHCHPLTFDTAPVVWGAPGTDGQHAFFQMLRQGTDLVPVEFIAVRDTAHDLPGHHEQLLANALAQARAMLQGQAGDDPHRAMPPGRPSLFTVLQALTPESLGALLALCEHRTVCCGALWGINSFDQFGVEQGKVIAQDIAQRLASGDVAGLDASTAQLIARLRA
ncbi:MAG: glucose-6-phosphate isomerase [Burkholderiaceae bacterium]